MIRLAFPPLAAALFWSAAADARTADYGVDPAELAADAEALGVAPPAPLPDRAEVDVVAENMAMLDHQLRIIGITCSAWEVANPLSAMAERALTAWDRDGSLAPSEDRPLIHLRFDSARSIMRCVEVSELDGRCLVRTSIEAEASIDDGSGEPRIEPLSIEVEHIQTEGTCSVARGTALSGWSAGVRLVERLAEAIAR